MELALAVLLALALAVLTIWSIRSLVADSILRAEVAEEIVQIIASDSTAVDALGHAICIAGAVTGAVYRMRDGIRTVLAIPIAGSDGRGIAYVNALRMSDCWSFASLTIHFERRALQLHHVAPRVERAASPRRLAA